MNDEKFDISKIKPSCSKAELFNQVGFLANSSLVKIKIKKGRKFSKEGLPKGSFPVAMTSIKKST